MKSFSSSSVSLSSSSSSWSPLPSTSPTTATPDSTLLNNNNNNYNYRLLSILKQYDNRLCADCREVLTVQQSFNNINNNNFDHSNHHEIKKDEFQQTEYIYASLAYGVK